MENTELNNIVEDNKNQKSEPTLFYYFVLALLSLFSGFSYVNRLL